MTKTATLYRMDMREHVCPFGLKAKALLAREGFEVEEHRLETREAVDAFKHSNKVKTTPQIWIGDQHIGGYDALAAHLGAPATDKEGTTYGPVIAIFSVALAMALALQIAVFGAVSLGQTVQWFIAISVCFLAVQKLQDVETFATSFLNYDLLAQRWIPYGKIYPYAEAVAGVLMLSGALMWLSAPLMLFIGGVGAVSVYKAVYIDRKELRCACVGGDSRVPLGFVSLTENVFMVGMGLWMLTQIF